MPERRRANRAPAAQQGKRARTRPCRARSPTPSSIAELRSWSSSSMSISDHCWPTPRTRTLPLRDRDEHGLTLVELVVAMGVLSLALTIIPTVLFSVQKATVKQAHRSQSIDETKLAVFEIE